MPDPEPEPDPEPDPEPGLYDSYSIRLAGDTAVQTSAKIALEAFSGGSKWAVLARDDDFADAMSATGLAGVLDAPIVLTDRFGLSSEAAEVLAKLGVENVYIIGGKGAMPGDFESELRAMGVAKTIERVYGDAAYDTSVACAEKIVGHGASCEYAIVAYGQNFQDALSMSSFAYRYGVPIFLQTHGAVSAERHLTAGASSMLSTGAFSNAKIFVAGGAGAVSEASVEGVFGGLRGGARLWGNTGFDTSNAIANYLVENNLLSASVVCVASGAVAPGGADALAGAALAGKAGGVVLLANGNAEIEAVDTVTVDSFLKNHASSIENAYILGGTYVMPVSLKNKIDIILARGSNPSSEVVSTVYFIDVGQGDSEFIVLPDGKTMLIDAGASEKGAVVEEFVRGLGYTKIDYVVATHPHADHIGGMARIVKDFEIGEIWMPNVAAATQVYENLLDEIARKGLVVHAAKAGATMAENEEYSLKVLSPKQDDYADLNDWSAIVEYLCGATSFLFVGDASSDVILSACGGSVDVLKVGHHGSKTSTDSVVASVLAPAYAIISCGAGNSYGHPSEQALTALGSISTTLRTDTQGTIEIDTNGEEITRAQAIAGAAKEIGEDSRRAA